MEEQITPQKSFASRHPIFTTLLIGVPVVLFILAVGSSGSSSSGTQATGQQTATTQPSGPCDNFDKGGATSSISFKELDKDAAVYNGAAVAYTGQVVQVQEAPGGSGIMRLSMTKGAYGWSLGDIIYVTYAGHTDAVTDDVVKVYGYLTGAKTYTSQANFNITVPSMMACEIDKQAPGQPAAQAPTAPRMTKTVPAPIQTQPDVTQQPPAATPPPVPAPQTPPPAPKSWHTVTTVTTATSKNTPPFAIQGTQWRATWSCQAAVWGQYNSAPDVYAMPVSSGFPDKVANPNNCPSGDVTYFYDGPGNYYLQIDVYTAATMTVTIEDYY